MALGVEERLGAELVRGRARGRRWPQPKAFVPYVLVSPAVLYMLALLGYPFLLALYFSLSKASVQESAGQFVGLQNYANVIGDAQFQKALVDSFIFTFGSGIFKSILGTSLAFLLLRRFPARKVIRGFLMLPWTLPIALSVLAFKFGMFDPQFSVVNWIAAHLGLIHPPYPNWLGDPVNAMIAVMTVNVWRGFPFSAIIVLAGLTSIPPEILDAARVDGANGWQRWQKVIVPMIAPILFVGLTYDVVFTFTDLSVVYLLTNGGPINATEILPTLAFRTGIVGGDLGRGSAIALFMLPLLVLMVVLMLRALRRRDI
ncbi:MAG TPA: sugar ABC transporter permease [Chloroflexota bacterium]|nr:sugar ABC transporter permease [Chloroflexota bacterium]